MQALTTTLDISPATEALLAKKGLSKDKLEKTAKDFEAVFMGQMLKPMWTDVKTDDVFGGGPGEDTMREMLIQEYGKSMVGADGGLLSHAIMDAMIKMQGDADRVAG